MGKRNAEQEKALEYLREYFKPGDTVYTVLLHVSSSGMSRRIAVLAAITTHDGRPGIYNVSHLVARAGIARKARNDAAVTVTGAGMDMGFSIAYDLGRVLYPDTDNRTNGGDSFKDGGYSLKHAWV